MTVLLVGFDGLDTERVSVQLREAGFSVVGASGRQSARTLARGANPSLVVVPEGSGGETAWSWVADLLSEARVVSVAPTQSAGELLARLRQVSALLEADQIETPEGSDAPITALPGQRTGEGVALLSSGLELAPLTSPSAPAELARGRRASVVAHSSGAPDLLAKLETVRFGELHQILEVEPGATAYVIEEQRERLADLYSPTGWPGPVSASDVPLLEEVQRGIGEAFEILGDVTLRAAYEEARQGASRPSSSPYARAGS